jgi:hypothetical protein
MRSFEWGEYITGLSHGMGVCLVTLRIQKGSEMKKMFVYFSWGYFFEMVLHSMRET